MPGLLWLTVALYISHFGNNQFAHELGAFLARRNIFNQFIMIFVLCYLSAGGISYLFLLLPSWLLLTLTTHITLGLLKLMSLVKSIPLVILLTSIDVLLAYFIYLPNAIGMGIGFSGNYSDNTAYDIFTLLKNDSSGGIMAIVVFVISFLPTGIHITITLLYLLARLLDKIIKPFVELIILRIAESKNGVLTQIAIGIGVLIKTMQELYTL